MNRSPEDLNLLIFIISLSIGSYIIWAISGKKQ